MTKVTVNTPARYTVKVNAQNNKTVRTVGIGSSGSGGEAPNISLDGLTDVVATDPENNEVLVYDANTDTYIISTLPSIDGGTF